MNDSERFYEVEENPFAAPTVQYEGGVGNSEADALRREHLNHEASIKSVGGLYLIGGIFLLIFAAGTMISPNIARGARLGINENLIVSGFLILLSVVQITIAVGLRSLSSWARIPAIIISILGLIAFPIGTIINGYILYLLLNAKGAMVLSNEYAQIVQATPHIKYKTSIIVKIFVYLFLAVVILGVVGLVLSGIR